MKQFALLVVALAVACGGGSGNDASSGGTSPTAPTGMLPAPAPTPAFPFTVSPMDPSAIQYIVALGAMAPWGHTTPTDHIYFYHHLGSVGAFPPVPLTVPASGTVTSLFDGSGGVRVDIRIDAGLLYWIGPLEPASGIVVGTRVEAGAPLGRTSGGIAFDFSVLNASLRLNFVNPARYGRDTVTADGPLKYFDEPVRSALYAKVRRTGSDLDGRLDYDVAGTLSGNWFAEDLSVADSGLGGDMRVGTRKLTFARDVYMPDRQRVSIGGLGMTGLWAVAPDAPDFTAVTPASGVVVYRLFNAGWFGDPPSTQQLGLLIVHLLDADRLRIEATPETIARSATFSSNAQTYLR